MYQIIFHINVYIYYLFSISFSHFFIVEMIMDICIHYLLYIMAIYLDIDILILLFVL